MKNFVACFLLAISFFIYANPQNIVFREVQWRGETLQEFLNPLNVYTYAGRPSLFYLYDSTPILTDSLEGTSMVFSVQGRTKVVRGRIHPNGGGFVAETTYVEASVFVDKDAAVLDQAQVKGNVRLLGQTRVWGEAQISEKAVLSNTFASGNVIIRGQPTISDSMFAGEAFITGNPKIKNSKISGNTSITGSAQVNNAVTFTGNLKGRLENQSNSLPDHSSEPLEHPLKEYVVKIRVAFPDLDLAEYSTGFFIDSKTIITDFHVVQHLLTPSSYLTIELPSGEMAPLVRIRHLSVSNDLAVLEVEDQPTRPFLKRAPQENEPPNKVSMPGFPILKGTQFTQFSGEILPSIITSIWAKKLHGLIPDKMMHFTFISDIPSLYGFSGGPVLHENGQVIGVLSIASTIDIQSPSVGSVTHIELLNQLLEQPALSPTPDHVSLIQKELDSIKNQAKQNNDVRALFYLGNFYQEHARFTTDPTDMERSFSYYKRAADLGYKPAQAMVARSYFNGMGTNQSTAQGFKWMLRRWGPRFLTPSCRKAVKDLSS